MLEDETNLHLNSISSRTCLKIRIPRNIHSLPIKNNSPKKQRRKSPKISSKKKLRIHHFVRSDTSTIKLDIRPIGLRISEK